MSIPRNLGNFADNLTSTGTLNVTGINATGTPSASTALLGDGTWGTIGGGANLQEFTSTGTWTKPSGATFVMVECWGGAGGGGSGRRGAVSTNRLGGSGGGGGAYTQRLFKASDLTSTVTVTIAAGGTGGAAITVDSTDGNNGTNGGNTTFGSYLTAFGGGAGQGGPNTGPQTFGGAGGGALSAGNNTGGGQPSTPSENGHFGSGYVADAGASGWGGGRGAKTTDYSARDAGGCSFQGGPGGGCGGLIASDNTLYNASAGGSITGVTGGGGAGGAAGTAGTAGSGRQGGGGGGYGLAAAAGAGGAGGTFGAGGGGGGASLNSFNSGAGGAGGAGLCRVYTW